MGSQAIGQHFPRIIRRICGSEFNMAICTSRNPCHAGIGKCKWNLGRRYKDGFTGRGRYDFARLSVVKCFRLPSQTESADEWSYQKGLDGGWIPQDPSQRLYPGLCNGGSMRVKI
jgi:hypothetical protein